MYGKYTVNFVQETIMPQGSIGMVTDGNLSTQGSLYPVLPGFQKSKREWVVRQGYKLLHILLQIEIMYSKPLERL